MNDRFWEMLDQLVEESRLVIDRPKDSIHPRYPEFVYPLDYGYLDGTTAGDGAGIDVWIGSQGRSVRGIICTVDMFKRDAEIKILIGCSVDEMETALNASNDSAMAGVIIKRDQKIESRD